MAQHDMLLFSLTTIHVLSPFGDVPFGSLSPSIRWHIGRAINQSTQHSLDQGMDTWPQSKVLSWKPIVWVNSMFAQGSKSHWPQRSKPEKTIHYLPSFLDLLCLLFWDTFQPFLSLSIRKNLTSTWHTGVRGLDCSQARSNGPRTQPADLRLRNQYLLSPVAHSKHIRVPWHSSKGLDSSDCTQTTNYKISFQIDCSFD